MRFKRRKREKRPGLGTIDIAPLIDIVFLLLIFFMLTSTFISQPGIEVNLPKAVTSEVLDKRNLIITITSENVIYLDKEIVTVRELEAKLSKAYSEGKSLLIKADRRASVGRVVEVWDLSRSLGIPRINIATEQSP